MNEKWEIRRVSTPERIFRKISEEMAQPVGVMICGADSDFKDKVYDTARTHISHVVVGYKIDGLYDSVNMADIALDNGYSVLVKMDEYSSTDYKYHHCIVAALRNMGAETVTEIYVKNRGDTEYEPNANGLDYLVVVEEERGISDE